MILSDYRLVRNSFPKRSWWERYTNKYSNKHIFWGGETSWLNMINRDRRFNVRGSIWLRWISQRLINFDVRDIWGRGKTFRMDPGYVEFILKSKTIVKI